MHMRAHTPANYCRLAARSPPLRAAPHTKHRHRADAPASDPWRDSALASTDPLAHRRVIGGSARVTARPG
jgi:hypothetical protein